METGTSKAPFAVIDIGSNSVRLVVFEGLIRAPSAQFNEKAMCGLGKGVSKTGLLNEEGVVHALNALRRFKTVCDQSGVGELVAFATAAVRTARNGEEFAAKATEILGVEVKVLSGREEAEFTALGVLGGIPEGEGVVGDLGGGSLELTEISNGSAFNGRTLPIGALDIMSGGSELAEQKIEKILASTDGIESYIGKDMYLVGGSWRAIGRVYMSQKRHPVPILHQLSVPSVDLFGFIEMLASQSKHSLRMVDAIPKGRAGTIAAAAFVLEKLMLALKTPRVVFSAHGVREGVLMNRLPAGVRNQDPAVERSRRMMVRAGTDARLVDELVGFVRRYFGELTPDKERLVLLTAMLSGISWRDHPDFRSVSAFLTVLHTPFSALSHHDRSSLSSAVYQRYGGGNNDTHNFIRTQMSKAEKAFVDELGAALRLGHYLSGHANGILPNCKLHRRGETLVLEISEEFSSLGGEYVQKRLGALANLAALKPEVLII